MGMFIRKKPEPAAPPPVPQPSVSGSDLDSAEQVLDRWDRSMGDNNRMWDCLEFFARQGGYRGPEWVISELQRGFKSEEVTKRPWRWWDEAARTANGSGRHMLVGRIFLFTHLFATQIAPNMDARSMFSTGLVPPPEVVYKDIATLAVDSLSHLNGAALIHDTATGQVDVASAMLMACEVSGVEAPQQSAPPGPPPIVSDGSQWN